MDERRKGGCSVDGRHWMKKLLVMGEVVAAVGERL